MKTRIQTRQRRCLLVLSLMLASACAIAQAPRAPLTGAASATAAGSGGPACPPLLDHTLPRLQDDAPQRLCQYAGRVILVVNTASRCGYTGQYEGLEALHARYSARGLVVLGFPSNDFGQQEPGDSRQIADLCFNTYAVRFPMFARTRVIGPQANGLHAALASQAGSPKWNFHKYLIGRDGKVAGAFPSAVEPLDRRLTQAIEKLL